MPNIVGSLLEAVGESGKALVDRRFLEAGLAPASLMVGGYLWYADRCWSGGGCVPKLIASLDAPLESPVWPWVVLVLVLGMVFRTLSQDLRRWLGTLPVPILGDWLFRLQIRAMERALRDREAWVVINSAFNWSGDEPTGVRAPDFFKIEVGEAVATSHATSDPEAIAASREARGLLAMHEPLSPKKVRYIGERLARFRHRAKVPLGAEPPREVADELEVWRSRVTTQPRGWLAERFLEATVVSRAQLDKVWSRLARFPDDPSWVAPTTFGTILATTDFYTQKRYGIQTSLLWDRMRVRLTEKEEKEFDAADRAVTTRVNLLFGLVGVFVLCAAQELREVLSLLADGPGSRAVRADLAEVVFFVAVVATMRLSYLSACGALRRVGRLISRSIDLHRRGALADLGLLPPATAGEERAAFAEVNRLLAQGTPLPAHRALRDPKP